MIVQNVLKNSFFKVLVVTVLVVGLFALSLAINNTTSAAPVVVFSDTFTETSANTELSLHTPDLGSGWTRIIEVTAGIEGGGNSQLGVHANQDQLRDLGLCGANDGALYQTNDIMTHADYEVSLTQVEGDSDDDYSFMAARVQDANNLYAFKWNTTDGQLYKRTAGVWQALGALSAGIADGSRVVLKVEGTTVSVYDDGILLVSVTDSDHTLAGRAGVGMGALVTGTDDCSAQKLDTFSVIVTGATLTIEKFILPSTDPGLFDLQLDGNTVLADASNGDSITLDVTADVHSVAELAGTNTNLADYTAVIGGDCAVNGTVSLEGGESKTCTITNTRKGSITLVKQTLPDGDPATFDFTGAITATLGDGGIEFLEVEPGSYEVTETVPADWKLTDISCNDGLSSVPSTGDINTGILTLNVEPGEDVLCTYTNTKHGQLTVLKNTIGGDGNFYFDGPETLQSFQIGTTAGTGQTSFSLPAGTSYDVTETVPAGWELTQDPNCSGTINPGDDITCIFENTKLPTLKIIKKTFGGDASFDFTGPEGGSFNLVTTAGTASTTFELPVGTNYDVTENVPAGWELTFDPSCSGTLQAGDEVECLFENTKLPTITLEKIVINDNGGQAIPADFELQLDGQTVTQGEAQEVQPNIPIEITELQLTGYSFVDITGDNSCPADLDEPFSLQPGEDVLCTITNNDQPAELIVYKNVINNNGGTETAGDFTIEVDATNPSPENFSGSETGTLVVMDAGNYSVSESGPTGYSESQSLDCSGSLGIGESATCTITNNDIAPSLTVEKIVINDNGGTLVIDDFTLYIDNLVVDHGVPNPVDIGLHIVSEDPEAVYIGTIGGDCNSLGEVQLNPGDDKTCTITNDDQPAKITLNKNVTNDNGGSAGENDFNLTIGGTPVTSGEMLEVDANIPIEINELQLTGYSFVDITGDAACPVNLGDSVTLSLGEEIECTITNDDDAPKITLFKDVINDNGGFATEDDFNLSIGGTPVASGEMLEVDAGVAYDLDEVELAGYSFVDITGDAACPVNLGDSVTLVLGETLECTITNDDNPASISGIKFHDLNANSIQDGIESGLAGWTIELRDDNGVLLDTNVTDIDGNYSFPSLASGDYRVQEVEQPGWKKTEPGGLYHPVSLALGESAIRDFGNYQLGSIHGTKYDDIDGDGQLDGFDVPLEGWTINLDGPGGPYTTQTDADGNYWFMDLELGSYNVSEEQQTGWIQTSATPTSILIEAGTVSEDNDFFNFKLAEIHGYKYHDLNNDGNKDAGEPGLPGWIINLGGAGNASTTTDGNGAYWFMDLGPGIYHLTEDNQPGWMQTEPGGGLVQYSPGSGAVRENLNFGNLQYATIIVEKQTLPDGETQNFDFSGDASGTIQDDGQIIVSGLLPGQYSSTETVPAGWDLTDITCDDNDSSGDINTAIATFELQAGEIVTCVFTNSKKPTLTVIKQVTNDDGGTATTSDFILYIDGNPVSSGVSTEVSIGAHIVSEDSLPGYTGTISGDCDANGNVEVDPNEDKTCIITNEDEGNAIHGQKFEDLNGNGVKDAGEPGLAGWRIRLRDMDLAQQHANTLTDANGNYWFMDLPPGNYRVTERQQTGWQITTPVSPARYDLQLDLGEVHEDLDFGNFKLGEIHGMKFNDLNNDGIKDAGEPGLENWTINITGPNGFATSTITDIDGNFWFMNLGLGDYEVSEVMQVGWLQSMPADNGNYEISIESSGQVFEDQDFGNFMPNAINGIKFEDVDGDGIYSSSTDVLLADWEIVLLDSDNNELASTTTDINGTFSFIDIEAGDYKVKEIQQTGWQASTAEEYELTFTTNNASTTDLFFGNYRPAEIHGVKFLDRNSDGAYQPLDEEGVSDWIIILELDGQEVATTTTDVEGEYWFMDLAPGTYDVTEEERDGWTQTFPGAPDYAHEVTVQSSEVVEDINFGNIVPASINGVKFEDLNGNGFRDENEPGLAGWRIRLRNLTTNVVIATTTDELGRYKFINIDPDDYRVSERQKDGWVQTAPQDPNTYTVTVNPGDIWVGADFGNFRLASVTGIKYEDINGNATRDEGEPALPGWTIELRDFEGTFIASTTTNALGQYTFNELGPETFLLNEVAQPDWFQSEPIAALGGVHTLGVNESGKTYERNFGNYRHGSIRGRKFQDDNFNGVRDSGEDWLAGWTIELTSLQTGATFQKVTNANGRYRFNNLAPGSYLVKEILQPGWLFTTPIVRHVKVLSNQNVSGIHFGNNEISEFLANGLSLPSPGGGPVQLSENSNDFEIQENPGEIDLPEINIELPEFIRNRSRSGLGSFGNRGR